MILKTACNLVVFNVLQKRYIIPVVSESVRIDDIEKHRYNNYHQQSDKKTVFI